MKRANRSGDMNRRIEQLKALNRQQTTLLSGLRAVEQAHRTCLRSLLQESGDLRKVRWTVTRAARGLLAEHVELQLHPVSSEAFPWSAALGIYLKDTVHSVALLKDEKPFGVTCFVYKGKPEITIHGEAQAVSFLREWKLQLARDPADELRRQLRVRRSNSP